MSGIFGVFNRNGESVSVAVLQDMQEAMAYWEPDTSGLWHQDTVGLGHAMLWNTPESKLERLPSEQAGLVISMDARLDNRDELVQELGLTDKPLEQIRESEFILAAYQKWGEDCPRYLIGDFAFVVWDEKKQQLFCARDHVGVKQFYFCTTKESFAFSNDLKGLAAHPLVSGEISDEAVANYLVNHQLKSPTLSFFEGVEKLPPAHSLTISADEIQKKCYWRLEDTPRVKLRDIESYAAKLRELLEQAVHDRMRSAYPITSHLSGGLDSSSIAVIAARKLRETGKKLLAFNWLHEPDKEDDPEHYEWSNSRKISEAEGIEHHYVPLTVNIIYGHMKERTIFYGDSSTFWYEYPVREATQQSGSRTILSGWGGDELSSYDGQAYYADLVTQGRIIKVIKELRGRAEKQGENRTRRFIGLLYRQVYLILIPRKLYRFMPRARNAQRQAPPFVKEAFMPAIQKELNKKTALSMQAQSTIRKHMQAFWQNGHIQARITSWASAAISNRLEYSYPLLDKRILEFAIGLPAECFVKNDIQRYLFRNAAEGLLPDELLWGNAKAESKRVERLLSLLVSAWKLVVHDGAHVTKENRYLYNRKLVIFVEGMNQITMDRDSIMAARRTETSMGLFISTGAKD